MTMTSSKPYLIRALYEWIVDNEHTPYVLVDAFAPGALVPQQYVKDGQIILNISPSAVLDLHIADEGIFFNARFGGIPTDVYAPMYAILGIYARENGRGMMFEPEQPPPQEPQPGKPKAVEPPASKKADSKTSAKDKPSLRVVK